MNLKNTCKTALFGNICILTFILTQYLDGILTYLGVTWHGITAEYNPMVALFITQFGAGIGLIIVKALALVAGILIYFWGLHILLALLSLFFITAAIIPWLIFFI